MNSLEKAQELVKRFYKKNCEILEKDGTTPFEEIEQEIAKQCALIAVDEILSLYWNDVNGIAFWNSVKTEINAL